CPAFFCRRKRIPADQNAVLHRLFSGGVPAGVGRLYGGQLLPSLMFLHRRCGRLKLQKHNFW
ncbi:hypothetical protein, partial [Agrobacterium tumefaciens]|uniref:hypothetical protein n=1 Tax=Agrobacterium tumefaciens TaxID=358 RepID=UPI001AEBC484